MVKDYDTMLNQTNIEANNNKFYRCFRQPGGMILPCFLFLASAVFCTAPPRPATRAFDESCRRGNREIVHYIGYWPLTALHYICRLPSQQQLRYSLPSQVSQLRQRSVLCCINVCGSVRPVQRPKACQALPRSEACAEVRARRLQMLQDSASGRYMVWTRWGRVGVAGQSKMLG